jgi:hypothetical protein
MTSLEPLKVYALISDCGLNGPLVHGIYTKQPSRDLVALAEAFARPTTGYQFTSVEEHLVDITTYPPETSS